MILYFSGTGNSEYAAKRIGKEIEDEVTNLFEKIRKEIGIPKGKKAAMTLVFGYPDVKYLRSTPHKGLEVRYM